tara:strand:+ start:200 stop:400 length:201 start_codon:yes stop_codon:yes gene_type:complete
MKKVEGHNHLYRDDSSGAIVNTDSAGYTQYIKARTQKENEKKELDKIKSDIEEIKSLLKEIVKVKV